MTGILESLRQYALKNQKKIIFPEQDDARVISAVNSLAENGYVKPVLLKRPDAVELHEGVEIFEECSDQASWRQRAVEIFIQLRAKKGITERDAVLAMKSPLLFSAVLLRLGYVDGAVSGSIATTADVLRAGIQGVGMAAGSKLVSSIFLMELPDGRVCSFGDCAVNPEPDASVLAEIAVTSAKNHQRLTGDTPRVALLSFSSRGSAEHARVEKVRAALQAAKNIDPSLLVDGELQFDSAFVPEIGRRKAPDSPVSGQANVFIFPDLDAGNIGYKIAERIGGAKALGPILQGLENPWMDLSRGCSIDDIRDMAIIASVMSG
ncbi:phosphate acetyltransferase [Spongiibacter sp. UBA1325]|jgi:phosphate acetyltransferase|uniref:phosphate acetyltransferase n=1 Tax=Spongiibacter sp. UBA1325 TaxID=1947543 RepID=UPI00257D6A21|nr:phosphate acetyltransferase [Spongiibacter sp. UBA1325]|tara:strand:+ start:8653 stop:9615 length:963 start_codon:yes stop_codon:yes gene_type:complete